MARIAEYAIEPMFLQRWSARAMSGEPLSLEQLFRLLEAARWAPSSGNHQPWRVVYALRESADFSRLFGLLAEGNRIWCVRASALLAVLSRTTFGNAQPSRTHSFDTGAAWMSLALQGVAQGLVVHAMEGFDYERARQELGVPVGVAVECMIAVGYPGRMEDLPERLRAREQPNDRNPVTSFAFQGRWPADDPTGR